MTVLVTGSGGYLGRRIVRNLVDARQPVVALGRHRIDDLPSEAIAAEADLCDATATRCVLSAYRPDTIIHCAAHIPRADRDGDRHLSFLNNVRATQSLLAVCRDFDVSRVVFASTISVYPVSEQFDGRGKTESAPLEPQGYYGEDKFAAESVCRDWCSEAPSRTCVILRYAGIHGGGRQSGVVHNFVTAALNNDPIVVDSPESVHSLLHVDDAATAALCAIDAPRDSGAFVFNIAGGDAIALGSLAELVASLARSRSVILRGERPARVSVLAIDAARSVLGFDPTPLKTWLKREIDLRSRPNAVGK